MSQHEAGQGRRDYEGGVDTGEHSSALSLFEQFKQPELYIH